MRVTDVSRAKGDSLELDILVSPRSNRSGLEGFDEWRKRAILRVKSPPLDGRANKEVESYFKEVTGCRSKVTAGMTSHQKTVTIEGDPSAIIESLEKALQ
ncbi:MAG: YggU family protein [Thermoplasmata archaeon]|nr:YggU family protein [Thermoplasmata archaeon]